MIRQAVVLAGGQGKRLRPLTDSTPKPMVKVAGQPFLAHIIDLLKSHGIEEVLILTGYLREQIEDYFGSGDGIRIVYSHGEVDWETGKRLQEAASLIDDEFLLLYGDNYWPLRLPELENRWRAAGTAGIVTVYDNADKFSKDNLIVRNGLVEVYDKSRTQSGLEGVDIGFFLLRKNALDLLQGDNPMLTELILALIKRKQLAAYVSGQPYIGLTSPDRMQRAEELLAPKKIVFLDRDGVINERAPKAQYITAPEQFLFLPGSLEAMKELQRMGFKIIIITNQPGLARGNLSEQDLAAIHAKMKRVMKEKGIDDPAIYYCPHNWDDGCSCRKPAPGLLYRAAQEHALILPRHFFVGDDERDIAAGIEAGCRTIFIGTEDSDAEFQCTNLKEAVNIVGKELKES